MNQDPIIEEIRRHREEIAARFNYDLAAIVKYFQEEQLKSGRPLVRLPPRRPTVTEVEPKKAS